MVLHLLQSEIVVLVLTTGLLDGRLFADLGFEMIVKKLDASLSMELLYLLD